MSVYFTYYIIKLGWCDSSLHTLGISAFRAIVDFGARPIRSRLLVSGSIDWILVLSGLVSLYTSVGRVRCGHISLWHQMLVAILGDPCALVGVASSFPEHRALVHSRNVTITVQE